MEIFPLNEFQTVQLSNFLFDVAKGSLLAGLGFTAIASAAIMTKLIMFIFGIVLAVMFLYSGLWLINEIER